MAGTPVYLKSIADVVHSGVWERPDHLIFRIPGTSSVPSQVPGVLSYD